MKSVLEASFYLVVMSLICLISLDFVVMNKKISEINSIYRYVENVVEIYGVSNEKHEIDEDTISILDEFTSEKNVTFSYRYYDSSKNYDYYDLCINYNISSIMFKVGKQHTMHGIKGVRKDI